MACSIVSRRASWLVLFGVVLFSLALTPPQASAQAAGSAIPAEAKTELAPTGVLRVALGISNVGGAFWSRREGENGFSGVPVELGKALAAKLGVPARFIPYENSGQVTNAAEKGEWDVTFVPMDAERAKRISFGPVYNVDDGTAIIRPGLSATTFAELDRPEVKIAAVANTTTIRGAARAMPKATMVAFENFDALMADLKAGKVDAFVLSRDNLNRIAADWPGSRVLADAFQQTRTAVAVPNGRSRALMAVSAFLEDAKRDGTLRRALDASGLKGTAVP